MIPRQAYAPTPHSYVPNSALSATINLDEVDATPRLLLLSFPLLSFEHYANHIHSQEVKLADTRAERDLQDSLAEIFSILVTLDELEKAFLKDAIPAADYTEICERSLKQYNSILEDETVSRAFVGLKEFKAEWDVGPPPPPNPWAADASRVWVPD